MLALIEMPLRDQLPDRALGIPGSPTIDKAVGELLENTATRVDLTEQQPFGVRGYCTAVECSYDLTTSQGLKLELFSRTLLVQTGPALFHVI